MSRAIAEPTTPAPTPAPYHLGRHPRRTDHPALLHLDGTLAVTFHMDATRTEIAGILRDRGLTLHDDDTVTWAPAASEPAPTRRRLLAGLSGAAVAGTALAIAPAARAAEHPDAALLAALAEFDALQRRIDPPGPGPDTIAQEEEHERLIAPLQARQAVLLDRICVLRARTAHGWRARARSLLLWNHRMAKAIAAGDNPDGYDDDRMIVALIRDMVGGPVT